ncbi:MAG TPA: hypothetical protein VFI15_11775 [Candidatus Limnocylindrales bacterium]|nr:hypothetical protein [Candidatus Limnocylindrales bacterium]
MNISTACRFGAAVLTFVALASAGAANAIGADPRATLGATVTANVYVDQSRELTVLNRSTVPILVTAEPSGGWTIEPAVPLVVAVDASVHLRVTGTGNDGARIAIRVRANEPAPDGQEATQLVLGARVYLVTPAPRSSNSWLVALMVVGLALIWVLAARRHTAGGTHEGRRLGRATT